MVLQGGWLLEKKAFESSSGFKHDEICHHTLHNQAKKNPPSHATHTTMQTVYSNDKKKTQKLKWEMVKLSDFKQIFFSKLQS